MSLRCSSDRQGKRLLAKPELWISVAPCLRRPCFFQGCYRLASSVRDVWNWLLRHRCYPRSSSVQARFAHLFWGTRLQSCSIRACLWVLYDIWIRWQTGSHIRPCSPWRRDGNVLLPCIHARRRSWLEHHSPLAASTGVENPWRPLWDAHAPRRGFLSVHQAQHCLRCPLPHRVCRPKRDHAVNHRGFQLCDCACAKSDRQLHVGGQHAPWLHCSGSASTHATCLLRPRSDPHGGVGHQGHRSFLASCVVG
mmetsp:Transcript_1291/g.3803  ORF Transcript_1291/g.3803 Transcript_1291/m.3803 type:complete len:251 (+) Transcript_1291:304-1056(+)